MKRFEKFWIPAVVLIALISVYTVFSEFQKLEEREAREKEMMLGQSGGNQARLDAATKELCIYMVWRGDKWVAPGIEDSNSLPYARVMLESTQKVDLYNDSSDYRRAALRWASQYNQEAKSIHMASLGSN